MSTEAAKECKLIWDPSMAINMQSANGEVSRTSGLARDVPFCFGDIILYLQVQVVENVPYRVILGRPFDVLGSTKVQNLNNGEQFITVSDPNTEKWASLTTYERGKIPKKMSANF